MPTCFIFLYNPLKIHVIKHLRGSHGHMCDPKPLYQIRQKLHDSPKNKKNNNSSKIHPSPQKKAQISTLILPYPSPLLPWLDRLPCLTILSAVSVWGGGTGFQKPGVGPMPRKRRETLAPEVQVRVDEGVVGLLLFHGFLFNGFFVCLCWDR